MATILRSPSSSARRREWRAQSRQRLALERPTKRDIQGELRRVGEAAAAGFEEGREAGVALALLDHEERIGDILTAHYRRTFAVFGNDLLEGARSSGLVHETRDDQGFFQALMQRWIEESGADKVQRISATTRNQIRDALLRGEDEGEGIAQIAKRIRGKTSGLFGRFRSLLIARTEIHSASNAAQAAALEVLELPQVRREWVAAFDLRTRDTHNIADGQIRPQGQAFDVGGFKLLHPGDPNGPPQEIINCFPAATRVSATRPEAVTRRWYDGPLIEVATRAGHKLAGTPNHPVLTTVGWKALGDLDKRDCLLSRTIAERVSPSYPDVARADASIGEVFNAFHSAGAVRRVSFGDVDFHGERPRHDVDVVRANGVLRRDGVSALHQHIGKLAFPYADLAQGLLLAACLLDERALGLWFAADSIVRRLSQPLSFASTGFRHTKVHSFAAATSLQTGLLKARIDFGSASNPQRLGDGLNRLAGLEPPNDLITDLITRLAVAKAICFGDRSEHAPVTQIAGDHIAPMTKPFGDLSGAGAGLVQPDHLVYARRFDFSGHLYNLEDPSGWFIAENVVVHNCRCIAAAVIPEDA